MAYRVRAVLLLSAITLTATAARADTFRDVFGRIVMGVGGFVVDRALDKGDSQTQDHLARGENYIDPKLYSKADEFTQPFSPVTGVYCYPKQEVCFGSDGTRSSQWTGSIYNK